MVFQLPFRSWARFAALVVFVSTVAVAEEPDSASYLHDSQKLFETGQYFKAARYAFAAAEYAPSDSKVVHTAYSWITVSLVKAGLPNAASYFFIKTLQSGETAAIRRVLSETESLLLSLGGELLRPYLIRHTKYPDYDPINKSAYLFSLGKDALLSNKSDAAIKYFSGMNEATPLWPFALQLRGSAYAILGKDVLAIADFKSCASRAAAQIGEGERFREFDDLKNRCIAGEARTLYQMDRFDDADRTYDRIPKASFVWPDILFEQAWSSYGRQEYNRTLGKLVSYKSPALKFVFNSEVDVLRAQTFLSLCLYEDANQVINEFNSQYSRVGETVKEFVESQSSQLGAFFELGKKALGESLYTSNETYQMANAFVRSPYFQGLVKAERDVRSERQAVEQFSSMLKGVSFSSGKGFAGFLKQVLDWRAESVRILGGGFVKNGLIETHAALISNFEKMAFIKLEMLKHAKERLINKRPSALERTRGNERPRRKNYQYYWSFNGEFWNDELGDYVFGLESECRESPEARDKKVSVRDN
ncbi:hypothetical protein WDW86_08215 [Bdellovibrionota bacterium FG-2]